VRRLPSSGSADIQPKSGYGTFDRPCSPPVTEFHLKQIAQTIWANASVSIAK
jgi:hypothetical protein